MRLSKGFVAVAAAAAVVLGLSACTDSSAPAVDVETPADFAEGSTMARLADAGEITIGTKFDQPGFGLVAPGGGDPEGFDVEMGTLVAAGLGIGADHVRWVEAVAANREELLERGAVDLVVATYAIDDARKARVGFAGPYYVAGQDLMVAAGNPLGVTGEASLADIRVCTVDGSSSADYVEDNHPDTDLTLVAEYASCAEALEDGDVDAVTAVDVILMSFVSQDPASFELVRRPFTQEPYGIGVARGDDAFRGFVNDVLEASFADGAWAAAWDATAGTITGDPAPTPPAVDRYR